MHFGLSEDQRLLQATLREFASKELPAARLRELFEAGVGYDEGLWRAAAGVGLQGIAIPERYGGAGLDMLDLALAFEVLGEAALPGPFLGHALASLALVHGGSDAQHPIQTAKTPERPLKPPSAPSNDPSVMTNCRFGASFGWVLW